MDYVKMVNIKPLWCHVVTMECFKSFPRRFFHSGGNCLFNFKCLKQRACNTEI